MKTMNNRLDEFTFYNKSNYSKNLKIIISIVLGFISLLLSPYGITSSIDAVGIDIPWSLLLPILCSMAFGWRYGLVSALAGAAFIPFLLWSNNGWANILDFLLYAFFFISIGFINNTNITKGYRFVLYRYLLIFSIFYIVIILSYSYIYNILLSFNSISTNNFFERKILLAIIIKECVNFSILAALSDLLLRIPEIRKLFNLPIWNEMKFNRNIFFFTFLICIIIWFIYVGLSFVLIEHSGFHDGHIPLAFLIIQAGGFIAARVVIHFTERQLIAFDKKRESEAYLKLQMDRMPIAYIVWDKDLCVKSWNPAAEKLFGYSAEEAFGKAAYEIIVPKNVQENTSRIWHDLRFKGGIIQNINENNTKSGELVKCEWTNSPIIDGNGKIVEIVSMVQDITQRIKAEKELKESNELLSLFIKNSPIHAYIKEVSSNDNRVLFASENFVDMIGFTGSEMIGKTMYELFPKEFAEKILADDLTVVSNGQVLKLDEDLNNRNYTTFKFPISLSDRNLLAGYTIDITDRKETEIKLRESEKSYSGLFNSVTEAIYIQDEKGYFIDVNTGVEKMSGYSREEIIGKTPEFLSAPGRNDLNSINELIQIVFITGKPQHFEFWGKRKNGEIFPKEVITNRGEYFGKEVLITTARDVSERKKADEEVKKSLSLLLATLESTADGILVVDLMGSIINFNNKFIEIWNLHRYISTTTNDENLVLLLLDQLKNPEEFQKRIKELYTEKEKTSFDIIELKDGRTIERYSIPQIFEGKSVGRVWSFRDVTERKKAEEALRQREFFFKETQRAAFIGSYQTDFIKGEWESSDVLDQIFGIDKSYRRSIQGWINIVHPDDQEMMDNYLNQEIIQNHSTFNKEYRIKRIIDGETRWVLGLGVADFDPNGNIISLIGTIQDITDRKKIADAYRKSEFRNSNILKTSLDGFWIVDLEGKFLDVNDAFTQMIGYSRDELLRMCISDIEVIYSENEIRLNLELIIKNGNERFESKYRSKVGRIIDVEVSVNYLIEEHIFFVFVNDISERKHAFEELRESKANLSAIIENTLDNIWAINTSNEIIYINEVFANFFYSTFGVKLEVGDNILNSIPDSIRSRWKTSYLRVFQNEHFSFEDKIDLENSCVYLEVSVNPILIDDIVIGASFFSRDITKRKMADEALRLSEERFKVISESAEEWIWEVNKDGLYTYSNRIVEKILGYRPDEIVGKKHFFDFFEPENKELFKTSAFDMFSEITAFKDFENVNIHKNGSKVIFKTSGSPILADNGELIGYRGADIDITIQKRIETALLESEEKYRLTFITSPDSVNINKMDGTYVDINEGYTRVTGYTREDVIGRSSIDIDIWYYPEDRKKLTKELYKKGFVSNLESVFRCKDGTLKTALMSARIIQINNTPHILSITRDITERKLLENAIIKSEEKFRKLFERSNDAIFLIDKKSGKYLDANKSAEKLTGYKFEDLMKLSTIDMTPINAKKRLSIISKIKRTYNFGEIEYIRPNGSKRIALLSAIPLSEGQIYGIAHDITERKQYEDALTILSSAVDQSPISVVITDTNGLIEYVNPKFTQITGYSLEEVMGKNPSILKSGYTSESEYKKLWETIASGKEWRGEFYNLKKNGDKFWESVSISAITNDAGKVTHYLAVKEDITEKKESERKILSSIIDTEEKERNRFSRELHDGLGPLLSTIKLYFQWMSETDNQDNKKLIIEKGERNINEAIETIREVSNNLSPRTLNTFGAIVAIKNFIDNVNHTQKILIDFQSNTEKRFEKNVETVLFRVTSELINNTLKYAKASKSEVNIYYYDIDGLIKLTYSDNGIGFDKADVFRKGKGMGLINIEQRVNTLEGKFKIESSEGNGVLVEIELPVLKQRINI